MTSCGSLREYPRPEAVLPGRALSRLFARGGERARFSAGDVLAEQDTPVEAVVLLTAGHALSLRGFRDEDVPVSLLRAGAVIGLDGICGAGLHRVTVRALGPAEGTALPRAAFLHLLQHCHEVRQAALSALAGRVSACVQEMEDLRHRPAEARVARYLLSLAERGAEDVHVRLPVPKTVMARHLGITPQSLSRVLRLLRRQGIDVRGRNVTIPDPARLSALLRDGVPQ